MKTWDDIAKELLKHHREASPTCAMSFTESAITEALSQAYQVGRYAGLEEAREEDEESQYF